MADPISFATAVTLSTLGAFALDTFKTALKDFTKTPVKKLIEQAAARFGDGNLPANHTLQTSLRTAVGQAARVLAYHLHDPGRHKLADLLEDHHDWPNLIHRLAEDVQGNLLPESARDHWLHALVEQSKDPAHFADLRLSTVLDDHCVTRLLEGEADPALRTALHDGFLKWVGAHVPDNGGRPPEFAALVHEGWAMGPAGNRLTFYDLVCVFFREHLKADDQVFRAFTADVLTGLRGELAAVKASLPDAAMLERFTAALTDYEQQADTADLRRFRAHLDRQNQNLIEFLRREFEQVHSHLDRQDDVLTGITEATATHAEESRTAWSGTRRRMGMVASAVGLVLLVVLGFWWQQHGANADLRARLDAAVKRDAPGSELLREFRQRVEATGFSGEKQSAEARTQRVLTELARDRAMTADELRQKMLQAAEGAEERIALADQLRRASEQESGHLQAIERDALLDLAAARYAKGDLTGALARYEQALAFIDRRADPLTWASIQNSVGACHGELGIRVGGAEANEHLRAAVAAFRAALEVHTRAQLPQAWAMTRNNLGNALAEQAGRSEGAAAVRLLAGAVTAYRAALEVYTRAQFPQAWALTQNNLGTALSEQAGRSEGTEAVRLLGEAVTAYRAALEVRTRAQFPQRWAMTQNNLGTALWELAGRSEGPAAVRLLGEAVTAYRAALEVYTRAQFPQGWARAQNNLGLALGDQAGRSEGPAAVRLLGEAVTAYRAALEVRTRAQFPQEWALTQNNLGAALWELTGRSEGPAAVRLLGEAVTACRAALEVRTRAQFPQAWAMTQNNLGNALSDQAGRSEGAAAVRLLGETVTAYRAALEVYTRAQFPQGWATAQNNLGNALRNQAGRSEGAEAVRRLGEAVTAYRAALEVYTERDFPDQHGGVSRNLALAEADLRKRQ